jgi:hypothetical protein
MIRHRMDDKVGIPSFPTVAVENIPALHKPYRFFQVVICKFILIRPFLVGWPVKPGIRKTPKIPGIND